MDNDMREIEVKGKRERGSKYIKLEERRKKRW